MRAYELTTETPTITLKRLHQMKLQRRCHAAQIKQRQAAFPLIYGDGIDEEEMLALKQERLETIADEIDVAIDRGELEATQKAHIRKMAQSAISKAMT